MNEITIQDLTIGYLKPLAKDLNGSIQKGDFIALVGQNGVGKSTFLRTVCGLQLKLSGQVLIDKQPIESYSNKEISKKISVVLTGKPESLNLTVVELVALGRHPYTGWLGTLTAKDKSKIEEAITAMEINYIATKKLNELSDGQLQKAAIARALAQDTDFIFLDEPTSHLDLRNRIDVFQLLSKISKEKGILISTHEVDQAVKVCDTFWCMDFGKALVRGKPSELVESLILQNYLHVKPGDIKK